MSADGRGTAPQNQKGYKHEARHEMQCGVCGRDFMARYRRARYCSQACQTEFVLWRKIVEGQTSSRQPYGSIAERLGSRTVEGSALSRVLDGAAEARDRKQREFEELSPGQQSRQTAMREGRAASIRRREGLGE